MDINQLIIVVILLVVYQQDAQIKYQKLPNLQNMNIIYKTDLFLQVLLSVKTGRGIIQAITTRPTVKKSKQIEEMKELAHPKFHKIKLLFTHQMYHPYENF